MRIFLVGGAVRDLLLGRTPTDLDYVVVGATPADMLAAGYRAINAEFPIFLDADRREYALARRERKTSSGHRGFTVEFGPEVTLEEDLGRRDLTVNAMAIDAETGAGEVIDPYGGRADLAARRLRHVSAEAFGEDLLRVLRVARFAAQLPGFTVETETAVLMQRISRDGGLAELTPERVFAEIERALLAERPSRFFQALHLWPSLSTSLHAVLPEVAAIWDVPEPPQHHPEGTTWHHTMLVVDWLAWVRRKYASGVEPGTDTTVLWAGLCHDLGKALTEPGDLPRHPGHEAESARIARALLTRLRAPRATIEAVVALCAEHMRGKRWREMRAGRVLRLLRELGALRDPRRLPQFLLLLEADLRGRGNAEKPERRAEIDADVAETGGFYRAALAAALSVRGADVLSDPQYAGKAPGVWVGQVVVQRQVAAIRAATKGLNGKRKGGSIDGQ